jgi:hypothetical protein
VLRLGGAKGGLGARHPREVGIAGRLSVIRRRAHAISFVSCGAGAQEVKPCRLRSSRCDARAQRFGGFGACLSVSAELGQRLREGGMSLRAQRALRETREKDPQRPDRAGRIVKPA